MSANFLLHKISFKTDPMNYIDLNKICDNVC